MSLVFKISKFFAVAIFIATANAHADSITSLKGFEDEEPKKTSQLIPYAFYNSNVDFAVAGAFIANAYVQPQITIIANAFYSSNNSYNLFYTFQDIQVPKAERLFLDVYGFTSDLASIESYRNAPETNPAVNAGSNGSDKDDFIESSGSDDLLRLDFSYLLPIGHGREKPIHQYIVDRNGLLKKGTESGGDSWNPFASGRSFITINFIDRAQDIEDLDGNRALLKATAISLGLDYDNTDYWKNPSYGSRQRVAVTRDWGSNDEDGAEWTTVEAEYSKFFDLGASASAFQRVIALNAWLIDTPTWNDFSTGNGQKQYHRPPVYQGATLGGLDRQRAYPTSRFSDRSAINYAVEYRHKTKWNPFPQIPLINELNIPWWQWVGFVELGRVHDEWDLSTLHQDMKWTIGAGARIHVEGVTIRIDVAGSEEQAEVQMFIGQTF